MRIGFFSDSYFPEIDGVTYTLKLWRDRLEERGHEVFIIYPESSEYQPEENEIPVRSVSNPFYEGYNIPVPTGFDSFPEDLDVVHCHSPAFVGMAGRFYARRNNIPSVYTHHTPLEEYFVQVMKNQTVSKLFGKPYVKMEDVFLKSFDVVTASTEDVPRAVETEKLPVGIDTEFFTPQEDSFIDEMELKRPIIGYSGRLSNEKNVGEIIELAREFDGSFVIVGEGPQKEKLVENAPENVVFKDFLDREKLPEFYSGINVFLTASTGDTLGLSTLEANACGTPVVAADVYPFNHTIKEDNGTRYTSGDIICMKEKVEEALEKSFDTRKAVEKYSLEKTIYHLEEIYSRLN